MSRCCCAVCRTAGTYTKVLEPVNCMKSQRQEITAAYHQYSTLFAHQSVRLGLVRFYRIAPGIIPPKGLFVLMCIHVYWMVSSRFKSIIGQNTSQSHPIHSNPHGTKITEQALRACSVSSQSMWIEWDWMGLKPKQVKLFLIFFQSHPIHVFWE
jgi:hypothetical protein